MTTTSVYSKRQNRVASSRRYASFNLLSAGAMHSYRLEMSIDEENLVSHEVKRHNGKLANRTATLVQFF